jgi:hypothetical protein
MDQNLRKGISKILYGIFLILGSLKLAKIIDWSWWWVTSPLWIPIVLMIIILFFLGVSGIIKKL